MSMSESHVSDIKYFFQLNNSPQFMIGWLKNTKYIITVINYKEMMTKTLSRYITTLYYSDKTLIVFPDAIACVSLWSFTIVFGTDSEIDSASISQLCLKSNGITKILMKIMKNKAKRFIYSLQAR